MTVPQDPLRDRGGSSHPNSVVFTALEAFRRRGQEAGLTLGRDVLLFDGSLVEALGAVHELGGTSLPLSDQVIWHAEFVVFDDAHVRRLQAGNPSMAEELRPGQRVWNASGAFAAELNGTKVLLAGLILQETDARLRRPVVAILGASAGAVHQFARSLGAGTPRPRIQTWGSARRSTLPPRVDERDLVIALDRRLELFSWLDRFWRLAERAAGLGIAPRKGLLLIGDPGTGKTQCIRHLLTRYPKVNAHLFIPGRRVEAGDPFGDMLAAIQVQLEPAIVIIEDIDRLAESNAVSAQYLLNCLDGLLAVESPTLWVATANDPSLLEKNLIDRPGRFDRIILFPRPEANERRELIARFSRLELRLDGLDRAVEVSEGLTGAHLREACSTAMLAAIDGDGAYGDLLPPELARLRRQHAEARRFQSGVNRDRVGFSD